MPTHRVAGGWRWGKHGKVYPTKAQADKQGRAIKASQNANKPWTHRKWFGKV